MENKIIRMNAKQVCTAAQPYFMNMAQCSIFEKIKDLGAIHVSAIVSSFDAEGLFGEQLTLNGTIFSCQAFARIDGSRVKRIYAYLLTAGEISVDSDDLLDCFYADALGTALVNGGRDLILERLLKEPELRKTTGEMGLFVRPFGPGFFGMDLNQIKGFFEILQGRAIGIELKKSGVLSPEKSCAGFYVAATDEAALPPADCKGCIGNKGGCEFCQFSLADKLAT